LDGWGGYVLKEKFKLIKLALKDCHQRHSNNLPARISNLNDRIISIEMKAESAVLLDEEIEQLHGYSEELFLLSRIIQVLVGSSRGCSGFVKVMRTQSFFIVLCLVEADEMLFSFL